MAALAQGAMAHAFEMDNLTKPDSGSRPGAVLFSAGLAIAQDRGLGGRALLTAEGCGAGNYFFYCVSACAAISLVSIIALPETRNASTLDRA